MDYPQLTFEKVDAKVFTNLQLAYDVLYEGGTAACALNASNEIAVDAFLKEKISFTDIFKINTEMVERIKNIQKPQLEDFIAIDELSRREANQFIKSL